jgi:hypothetical protein
MTLLEGKSTTTDPAPGRAQDARPVLPGARMPWGTVVVLSVLMAYADGFVLTSVQGAVGAIQRTTSPFATWLRTSTLLLPVFFLAVLGAFAFARRRLGPALHRPRTVIVAALLVIAAGSLVGTAEVAVSAVYDYHLQSAALQAGAALHGHVHGAASGHSACAFCTDQARTRAVDELAARDAGRVILGANAVLVFWVAALRGGRLDTTPRSGRASRTD